MTWLSLHRHDFYQEYAPRQFDLQIKDSEDCKTPMAITKKEKDDHRER